MYNFRPQPYRPGFPCRRTSVGMFPVCSREDREQRVSEESRAEHSSSAEDPNRESARGSFCVNPVP